MSGTLAVEAGRPAREVSQQYGSPSDVARYLGLSIGMIRGLVASGKLPSHRVGARILIAFSDADAMVQAGPAATK